MVHTDWRCIRKGCGHEFSDRAEENATRMCPKCRSRAEVVRVRIDAAQMEREAIVALLRDRAQWYVRNRSLEMGSRRDECVAIIEAVMARHGLGGGAP